MVWSTLNPEFSSDAMKTTVVIRFRCQLASYMESMGYLSFILVRSRSMDEKHLRFYKMRLNLWHLTLQ